MNLFLLTGLALVLWFSCIIGLYLYFTPKNQDKYDVGSYWFIESQPFYGEVIQIIELDPNSFPNGVLCKGHSKDTNKIVEVWINRDQLKSLDTKWGSSDDWE